MKKVSTAVATGSRNILQQKLMIGLDLGDRNSWYCVLDEGGQIQLEQRVRTSAKALQEAFGGMPRSRIALETGIAGGADVILIIAAAVSRSQAAELAAYARSLDLQVLLEVHNANELNYMSDDVNIVGVNNRDLKTFKIDTEISVNLACEIPARFLKISESGITPEIDPGYDGKGSAIQTIASSVILEGKISKLFTFEIKDGPGTEKYWGRWGLMTNDKFGAPEIKPRYNAIRFLNKMTGSGLTVTL